MVVIMPPPSVVTHKRRQLDHDAPYKPLDFGGYGTTGSVNLDGRVIAINQFHQEYGYVTVTSARSFSEEERYDSESVRNYRRDLVHLDGFGFAFETPIVKREAWLIEDAIPQIRLTFRDGKVAEVITFVVFHGSQSFVVQKWNFTGGKFEVQWQGTLSIQRSAYTQLTEGGPLPPPSIDTRWHQQPDFPDALVLENRRLHQQFYIGGLKAFDYSYPAKHKGRVHITVPVEIPDDDELYLCYAISPSSVIFIEPPSSEKAQTSLNRQLDSWSKRWTNWQHEGHLLDLPMRRGLVYTTYCSVPVHVDATCLLTDHMLLPLSWNRDSFYAAIPLLRWQRESRETVRQHLIWMFEVAQRVDGMWGRAYLANGNVKDPAFQLDQQLYPLLELAAYVQRTGDTATLDRLLPHVQPVIDGLMTHKAENAWLFKTDETPADDPIEYPYHLSSHILMWYTFKRLSLLDIDEDFAVMRDRLRRVIDDYFITELEGVRLYAYACDALGGYHCYHDANDMPLVLAPLWGLVPVDDTVWRATMDFAFTESNIGGEYDGKLGSVHTRGPWPLGDVQEIVYARLIGDEERVRCVEERLAKVAQWDGALPEAYNAASHAVISRNWFVWPNAMLAYINLE